jgi:hypothetical protein
MWKLESQGVNGWRLVDEAAGVVIAENMTKEHATLFGHAPGLLRACKTMLPIVESHADDSACVWVHDLINEAEGR